MLAIDRLREPARILLACVRLLMGLLGLLAPGIPARQIGVDPDVNPGILYVFRMFGVRTVLIGAELLMQTGDRRAEALRRAVVIHASDTLAATMGSLSGNFPKKGRIIVLISAAHTLHAVIARR